MKKVGLTGGIGSGKSTVARVFSALGVPVFHADDEAKRSLNEDDQVKQAVIAAFGMELYASGTLDRKVLATRVFSAPDELAKLNAIVHPVVRARFRTWCEAQGNVPYVVMEAAILAETGGHAAFDHMVVVSAPEELRIRRVMERDDVDHATVLARVRAQAGDAERAAIADTVIVNDGEQMVLPQVLALHHRLSQP